MPPQWHGELLFPVHWCEVPAHTSGNCIFLLTTVKQSRALANLEVEIHCLGRTTQVIFSQLPHVYHSSMLLLISNLFLLFYYQFCKGESRASLLNCPIPELNCSADRQIYFFTFCFKIHLQIEPVCCSLCWVNTEEKWVTHRHGTWSSFFWTSTGSLKHHSFEVDFSSDAQNHPSKLDIILVKVSSEFKEKVIFCA